MGSITSFLTFLASISFFCWMCMGICCFLAILSANSSPQNWQKSSFCFILGDNILVDNLLSGIVLNIEDLFLYLFLIAVNATEELCHYAQFDVYLSEKSIPILPLFTFLIGPFPHSIFYCNILAGIMSRKWRHIDMGLKKNILKWYLVEKITKIFKHCWAQEVCIKSFVVFCRRWAMEDVFSLA